MSARTRRFVLAALTASALAPSGLGSPAQATPQQGMVEETFFTPDVTNPQYQGDLKQYRSRLRLLTDAERRRLLTLDDLGGVAAYNLDSLKATSRTVLELGAPMHAAVEEPAADRALIAVGPVAGATTSLEAVTVRRGVPVVAGRLVIGPTDLGGAGQEVVAIAPDPHSQRAYLMSTLFDPTGFQAVARTVQISLVDTSGMASGRARVVWSKSVPDCVIPAQSPGARAPAALGYSARSRSLFLGCAAPTVQTAKLALPVGVGRLSLIRAGAAEPPRPGAFQLFPFPGVVGGFASWDQGTERLTLETHTTSGNTVYSFDALTDSYVGGLGVGANTLLAVGVDHTHGRYYALSGEVGLIAADLAPVPLDLGHAYGSFAKNRGAVPGASELAVDARTGRLFVNYLQGGFVVLRDTTPYYRTPAADDPDAGTTDVAEQPGRTAAVFSAAAQGYGAVYRQVGGTSNLAFNVVPFVVNVSPVSGGTRELDLALLNKLSLDSGSATASVITMDRDKASTQADEQRIPPGTPAKWPYAPIICGDFGGSPRRAGTTIGEVACDSGHARVSASAVAGTSSAGPSSGSGVIEVSRSEFSAAATRTATEGAVASVTSTVTGVSVLGGLLRIGQVQVTVRTVAHGRPGTAHGVFTRRVSQVEVAGSHLCASACDPDRLAATVNTALAGRVHISFPAPSGREAKGSPGGAAAVVRRSAEQQIEAELLDQQDPSHQEIPGMVVTVYQDNNVPSRTIALLAGAAAEAHYDIYRLGSSASHELGTDPRTPPAVVVGTGPRALSSRPPGPSAPTPVAARVDRPHPVLGSLGHGVRVALNGLSELLRLLAVWMVLLMPVYLSARRRLLLERERLTQVPA